MTARSILESICSPPMHSADTEALDNPTCVETAEAAGMPQASRDYEDSPSPALSATASSSASNQPPATRNTKKRGRKSDDTDKLGAEIRLLDHHLYQNKPDAHDNFGKVVADAMRNCRPRLVNQMWIEILQVIQNYEQYDD